MFSLVFFLVLLSIFRATAYRHSYASSRPGCTFTKTISGGSRDRNYRLHSNNDNKENEKLVPTTDINRFENFLLQDGQGAEGGDMSLDEGMRVKLKSEVVSPFRRFRQFILFGILASAGLGTFTAIPQLFIALNNPENSKIPLETAYQNVGIDLIGLLGSAYFLFKDFTSKYLNITSSLFPFHMELLLITSFLHISRG